jgi:hypothetical protein
MTKTDFFAACAARFIDPALALENEAVIAALLDRDAERVLLALDSEF